MTIQNTKIVLTSKKPTYENIYFKIQTLETFISRVTCNDCIVQFVSLNLMSSASIKFEIWSYSPHKLIKSWSIESLLLFQNKKKYVIEENQWTVTLQILDFDFTENKENKVGNKKSSVQKSAKTVEKKSRKNCSHCKQVNVAILKKNKDKVGVKKALKHTIDCLIKQEKQLKRQESEDWQRLELVKTAKCSPSVKILVGVKNQSVLFSDYGFDSSEFNKKFAAKQTEPVQNEENHEFEKILRKKKSKVR